jgi:hypothetical protein
VIFVIEGCWAGQQSSEGSYLRHTGITAGTSGAWAGENSHQIPRFMKCIEINIQQRLFVISLVRYYHVMNGLVL